MNTERPIRAGQTLAALLALMVVLFSHPASAADLALLRNGFTIRHERRVVIGDNTRLFFDGDNASFIDVPTVEIEGFEKDLTQPAAPPQTAPAAALDLNEVVNSASAAYHLDPDLVNSVIHAESGFNSHAVSRKGAQGLMQLMPGTASRLGVADAFDPQANVHGGSRYLRELLERYNFDLVKALAAYNAGPERVEQYKGVPPYSETRAYVARIVRDYNRKKLAQDKQAAAEGAKAKSTKPAASASESTASASTAPSTQTQR